MSQPDAGRFLALVSHDIGWDMDRLVNALGQMPARVLALREQIAPIKTEHKALQARYMSKGTHPSRYDNERKWLLSELKEEARIAYNKDPDFREDPKSGRQIKIEITDGRAEDIAHGSVRYRKFLEAAEADHARIKELGRQLGDLYNKIEALEMRKEYLIQKLELARALTYAWKAEARL